MVDARRTFAVVAPAPVATARQCARAGATAGVEKCCRAKAPETVAMPTQPRVSARKALMVRARLLLLNQNQFEGKRTNDYARAYTNYSKCSFESLEESLC